MVKSGRAPRVWFVEIVVIAPKALGAGLVGMCTLGSVVGWAGHLVQPPHRSVEAAVEWWPFLLQQRMRTI